MRKLLLIIGMVMTATMLIGAPVSAVNVFESCNGSNRDSAVCKAQGTDDATSMMTTVINTILLVLGIIAVIMIIIGGLRYVVSAGDSNAVNGAKNTILYAVIGLVIAMLAYAIVNFVLSRF